MSKEYEKPDLSVLNDNSENDVAPLAISFIIGPFVIAAAVFFIVVGGVWSVGAAAQIGTALQGVHIVHTEVDIY